MQNNIYDAVKVHKEPLFLSYRKVSSFFLHSAAPWLILCLQHLLELSLCHTGLCFSTSVPQRKCSKSPSPFQTSGEVTCSFASFHMELLCCAKGDFVRAAFQEPLEEGVCLPTCLRCLECRTAADEFCKNITTLTLNYHISNFKELYTMHGVSLCTPKKCIYSGTPGKQVSQVLSFCDGDVAQGN